MNIFYLDEDPRQCAEWMVDKHVVKMILETAQLLSTAHRILDGVESIDTSGPRKKKVYKLNDDRDLILYSATHINHPSAVWTRQAVENYNWLVDHLFALSDEYTYRYGKQHATITKLGVPIASPPLNLKEWDMTPMPSCMDEQYKIGEDPIANYRSYYVKGKSHLKKYTKRDVPYWWSQYE
jgi:hypothetical protein